MAARGQDARQLSKGGSDPVETHTEPASGSASAPNPTIRNAGIVRPREPMRRARRRRSRPLLSRHSSLADLAREHKLKSRNSSTDDTRKFFSRDSAEQPDNEEWERQEQVSAPSDSPLFLLHETSGVSTPESPNFLYRTGSHVFMLAGHELGDSRHNSPIHSAAHSAAASRDVSSDEAEGDEGDSSSSESSNAERLIYFDMHSSPDSSSDGVSDDAVDSDVSSTTSVLWNLVIKDVLGFNLKKPASAEAKRRDREKTTGVFDPALVLALAATYIF